MKNVITKTTRDTLLKVLEGISVIVFLGITTLLLPGVKQNASAQTSISSLSSIKHVFVIMMENHDWSAITPSAAPYIWNTLIPLGGHASNYHNVLPTSVALHPSEPNYIYFEGGTNTYSDINFTTDNDASSSNSTASTAHLATLLNNKGLSWKAYQEGMPAGTCPITSGGTNYAAKHDPFVFFKDVSGNPPSSTNSYCASHHSVLTTTQLQNDLNSGNVANYNFLTPNLCNDMHDCSVTTGDTWLSTMVPIIMNSSIYKQDGLILITWDEGCVSGCSGSNNPIGMIVLSPFAKKNYTSSQAFSHASSVRTIEDIFGLSPYIGHANDTGITNLSDFFSLTTTTGTTTPTTAPSPTPTPLLTPTPTKAPTPTPTKAPTPTPTPTTTTTGSGMTSVKTVFVIMIENMDWSTVKGNTADFPYLNSMLPQASWADNYVTPYHPSLPNYISLEAASDMGWNGNGWNMPGNPPLPTTDHLTTYLNNAGISWKYYGEDVPGNGVGCPTTDPGKPYSMDHNPFPYFDDVRNNTSYCQAHERPYTELATDLTNNTTARYNFIVPNDYDQAEHIAPNSTCGQCQADAFLKTAIPPILNSAAYKNNGALFILWDEPDMSASNPSGIILFSPLGKKNYENNIPYQGHASFVRSMQEIFNVTPFIRDAATATDLSDLFTGSGTTTPTPSPTPTRTPTPTPTRTPTPQQSTPTPTPTVCPTIPTSLGTATTTFTVPSTGTYTFWSRINPYLTADSYYLALDNQCAVVVGDTNSLPSDTWTWIDYRDANPSSKVQFSLAMGTHVITLTGRESGLQLDRLLLTTDTSCVPTGLGTNCDVTSATPTSASTPTPSILLTPPPSVTPTKANTPTPLPPTPTPTNVVATNTPVPTSSCATPAAPTLTPVTSPLPVGPVTLTWSSVPNAVYAIRINDLANAWNGSCTSPNAGDVCQDNLTQTSFTFTPQAGHTYGWWMNAVSCNVWSPSTPTIQFTVSTATSPTAAATPTPAQLKGDFNNDKTVDILDFNIWRDEFTGVKTTKLSDGNGDGVVDLLDFSIWLNAFNGT